MSRHYKPGESDDLEFVRFPERTDGQLEVNGEASDDPFEDIEDQDGPEDDDDRAGVL